MQHEISGELIGGILGISEGRYAQQIEDRGAELVGNGVEELPNHRVVRRNASRGRFLGNALANLIQILVTKRDRRSLIPSVRPAIAANRLERQVHRQSKWTENFLYLFENPTLFDKVVQR